jgi:hypothetical protein
MTQVYREPFDLLHWKVSRLGRACDCDKIDTDPEEEPPEEPGEGEEKTMIPLHRR